MKQLHTYLFTISILITSSILGQETKISARDTLPPSEKYGLRVGIDISRLVRSALNDNYTGLEIIGDYRFYKDFYIAGEIGNESLIRDEENLNVKGSGNYIRVGFDYNAYDNWYGMQNSIYAGIRFGFSSFDQTLNSYRVFTGSTFFPNEIITDEIKSKTLTSSWAELVLGLKVELFGNLYLGANVSLRGTISEKKPELFDNLFIPGYGRTNDFSQFGVGYGYSISYLIPFIKKKR